MTLKTIRTPTVSQGMERTNYDSVDIQNRPYGRLFFKFFAMAENEGSLKGGHKWG